MKIAKKIDQPFPKKIQATPLININYNYMYVFIFFWGGREFKYVKIKLKLVDHYLKFNNISRYN